jgi:hypothetical protein
MMKFDREPIAFGQLALSVSMLAFALLLYLVSFGGPSQHLAEICVLALSFGAFKIHPVEISKTVENGVLSHAQVSKPPAPTVRVQLPAASLKPVTLPRPMPRVVWTPVAVASATGKTAELELAETIPAETTPSAAPPADIISKQALSTETASVELPSFEPRLWMHEVDDIARRHSNKFKFALSPLVYGPEAEVMPIINACLPAGSLCDVTARCREIIILGREQYALVHSGCSQKKFVGRVRTAHDSMRRAGGLAGLKVSYDTFCSTLTGRSPSLEARLGTPMPSEEGLQLILL